MQFPTPHRHGVRRPARDRPLTTLAALTAATALVAGLGQAVPASADPSVHDARAQAAALQAEVARLQTQAEVATERYDATEARLGQVVTQHVLAQRRLEAAQNAVQNGSTALDRRVRALYMSGGPLTLLATVLDSDDITDALTRLRVVQSVVSADRSQLDAATGVLDGAARLEQQLRDLAEAKTKLQKAAADQADQVQSLLARQQSLLAGANAHVAQLVAEQQAAAARAAAEDFAARLAAARAAVIDPSLLGGSQPPDAAAAAAIAAAGTRLGAPYVWGAAGPDSFDCSGLVQWAYAQAGVALPRVAADQWNAGPHPGLAQLAPGDLLFWATDPSDPSTIHHVAIYLGGGNMIAAPHTGDVVKVQPVYLTGFVGATRPTASGGP